MTGKNVPAAKWQRRMPIYVGDTYGNPRELLGGVVTVGRRTVVGLQIPGGRKDDLPDFTLDAEGISDLMRELGALRSALIKETGGLS